MLRTAILAFGFATLFASMCHAQETPSSEPVVSDRVAGLNDRVLALEERNRELEGATDFLRVSFILLMFTNAIICGKWAINTDRNFWGWYLFGLFTGPLAGGVMLHRCAIERHGTEVPGGLWGAVAGIGIPAAGCFIWMLLLR